MPHAKVTDRQRENARELRRTMTPAETLLWRHIKAGRLSGLSFRRQVPMAAYIADFVCHQARLVVELDGESHEFDAQIGKDRIRDRWFRSQGYEVVRCRNEDVMSNLEDVLQSIRIAAEDGGRSSPPSLPLPHKGGGNDNFARDDEILSKADRTVGRGT